MSAPPPSAPARDEVAVADVPDRHRYEARIQGQLAAIAEYLSTQEFLGFSHTEVLPGFEGQGIATTLVARALDDVRHRRLRVMPLCPFVAAFIHRHPQEYGDLVFTSSTRETLTADD